MSGEDLVRAVLSEVAPQELPHIDLVLDAYRRSPWPVVPEPDGHGHPTGAGVPVDQVASWGVFVTAFVANVLATMLVEEGVKRTGRGLLGWFRKPKPQLTTEVPRLVDEGKLAEVRAAALQAALDRGFPDSSAERFADSVATILQSRRS
jgi:hypothetical protein